MHLRGKESHLEPGVGNMWVLEGEKLSTEGTLAVLDGLVNLEEENTKEEEGGLLM